MPPTRMRSNVHVLRERLEAAEARGRRAEGMLSTLADLQGQVADLEQQLSHWRLILGGAADCNTPEEVLHLLTSLQAQQVTAAPLAGQRSAVLLQAEDGRILAAAAL